MIACLLCLSTNCDCGVSLLVLLVKKELASLRFFVPLFSTITLWMLIYHKTVAGISFDWLTENQYSDGYLSLCLAIYVGWRQRAQITQRSHIDWTVIGLIVLVSIGCWMGKVANVVRIEQLGVYLLLVLVFVAICGWSILRTLVTPFLILLLTIPVWDFFEAPLQYLSTIVALHTVELMGIPALREGFQISMPGGSFVVEPACGGLGFFLTAITLAVFYSYLAMLDWRRGLLLAAIAAVISIVSNWIRIVAILIVGNETRMQNPIVSNHITFGWILFALALIPFFYICHRWFYGRFETLEPKLDISGRTQLEAPFIVILATVASLLVVPAVAFMLKATSPVSESVAVTLPQSLPEGMVRSDTNTGSWNVSFPGASQILTSSYVSDGRDVSLLVVVYKRQSQGRELINVNNRLSSSQWNESSDRVVSIDGSTSVRLRRLTQGFQTRLLVYWYVIAGRATSNPVYAKLLEVYGALIHDHTASLIVLDLGNQKINHAELVDSVLPFYKWSVRPVL